MLLFKNMLWLKYMNISCNHESYEMKLCEKALFKNICIHNMYTLTSSTTSSFWVWNVNNRNNSEVNTFPSALNSQYDYKHFGKTEKI